MTTQWSGRATSDAAAGGPGDRSAARMSPSASARVAAEVLNIPRTADVVVREPGLRTPRADMHWCSASITTMTPRAPVLGPARRRPGW